MKYFILQYMYTDTAEETYLTESRTKRNIGRRSFVELVSASKLKQRDDIWNQFIVDEFADECPYDVFSKFETYINEKYDLCSWDELLHNDKLCKADNLSIDLMRFLDYKKEGASNIKRKQHIIYFLKDGDEVVYVGQSKKGVSRVYEHQSKKWDSFDFIKIDENYNLSIIEMWYINKFKPRYNRGNPVSTDVFDMVLELKKERENGNT